MRGADAGGENRSEPIRGAAVSPPHCDGASPIRPILFHHGRL